MRPSTSGAGTAGMTRLLLGPLLVNHVLILAGAFLIVDGFQAGFPTRELAGATILGIGIAIEMAVVMWSASLIRQRSATFPTNDANVKSGTSRPAVQDHLCPRCGVRAPSIPGRCCSRCGFPLVLAV